MPKFPDKNPAKRICQMALTGMDYASNGDLMEEVIRYAFDQLCWVRTGSELLALTDELRALVAEDA